MHNIQFLHVFRPTASTIPLFPIFRPDATPPKPPKRKKKKKAKKTVQLTDKERAQAARDHYYLHHAHEAAANPFADRIVTLTTCLTETTDRIAADEITTQTKKFHPSHLGGS